MSTLTIQDQIDFLQRYIIVHSFIYYELNNNVISDRAYDESVQELLAYKADYPDLWKSSMYYKQFSEDYNGATGFNLYHELDERQKNIIRSIAYCVFKKYV